MSGFGEKNEAPNWKKSARNDRKRRGDSCAKGHAMVMKLPFLRALPKEALTHTGAPPPRERESFSFSGALLARSFLCGVFVTGFAWGFVLCCGGLIEVSVGEICFTFPMLAR